MPEIAPKDSRDSVVLRAPSMIRIYEVARRAAVTQIPVLIAGETGTGKELVAQALHRENPRATGPFVAVNCGALVPTLVESELFGRIRGAFTGADRNAAGAFQQADGGTLFLDEVGELSLAAQAALLRAIETGSVRAVGAAHERRVSVRIVTASNRDLDAMVACGAFRRDLLYRIDALTLRLPPLRERCEEIEPLAEHFLQLARERGARADGGPHAFDDGARRQFLQYSWPGNVRELRNAVESAAAVCEGAIVASTDLPERIQQAASPRSTGESHAARIDPQPNALGVLPPGEGETAEGSYRARLRAYETQLLLGGLRRAGGNQYRAAQLLEMPRRTFCRRIKELGITRRSYTAH